MKRGQAARVPILARFLPFLAFLLYPLSLQAGPAFQVAGTMVGGTGAVSPAWPAHVADDIGLLFVESAGGEPASLSVPNGFTAVSNSPQCTGTGTAGTCLSVFWARAASGAMAAPTVADPGDHVQAVIITFRGVVASGDPWDVTGGGVKTPASVTISATGVTNTVEDTLLVLGVSSDLDSKNPFVSNWDNSNLTGITEQADDSTNSGNGGGIAVMTGTHTAVGATGTTVVTVTSGINAYLNIALKRLTAPNINSLTPEARQLSAGWPLISGAAGYTLVAALAQANPPALTYYADTTGAAATVTSLAANTTYYVYSRSNGTGENSEWKFYRATATLVEFPPASPVISGVTDSAAQLGWSNNGNPPGGNIYRVLVSTAADPLIPAGAVVTSSDTYGLSVSSSGLRPDTTYYFKAAGINRNNVPTSYITASTCTSARIPLSPVFGTVAENSIQYSWSANNNPAWTKYRVQVSTAANMDAPAGAVVTSSDTYNLSLSSSGLSLNTTYYFRVAAVNQGEMSTAYTAAGSTATRAGMPAFAPFSGVGTGAIQLNWTTSNPSGTLYRVQVSTASDMDLPGGAAVTTADTYSLGLSSSGLVANTTYYFRAAAIDHSGVSTGYFAAVTTATLADAPVFSALSGITASAVTFSWTASNPGGTLYRVISSTASDWQSPGGAAVVSSDTYNLSLSSSGLSVNTTYYFWAAALNRREVLTDYAAAPGAATQANAPSFSVLAVPSSGEIVVSWTANGNPAGTLYRAAVSTATDPLDPGFAAASSSDTYNFSLSSSGLYGNTTYYFRLAGVNRSGTVSDYTIAYETSTLAAQPSSFNFAGVSSVSVQLSWSGSGNGPGTLYRVQVSTVSNMDDPAGAVVTSTETYDLYVATSGLTYSTEYFFRAAAVNNNGIMTSYAAAGSTSTLAPGVLSAPLAGDYTPYVSSITAGWTFVSGADNYTLAASVNPGAEPSPIAASSTTLTGTELSAYVEGLTADTVYYLFARANGPGDPSAWAYYPAVATLLANPPLFDSFSGVGTNAAGFSWTANDNAYPGTQYRVVSSTAPDPLAPGGAVAVSSYTYNLSLSSSGLSANTTYYFSVAGVNKDGVATAYTAVQATATAVNAPVFTDFTGISAGAIQFNWDGTGNPTDTLYRVWTSTATDPLSPGGAAVTSSDTYNTYLSSSGLSVNTVYYFRVVGINRAGGYTAYAAAVGTATLANAPAFQSFSGVTSAAAAFSWTAPANPAGTLYRVLSSSSASPQPGGAGVISSDTYNMNLSSPGLTSDRAYYFSVAAVNHSGIATAYTSAESTYTLTDAPAASGFTGMGPSAIQFNWTSANPAGTLYRVWTSTAADPLAPAGAAVTSSDTYNAYLSSSGLSVNVTYYFRVTGINGGGSPTAYTAPSGTSTLTNVPAFSSFTEVWTSSVQFNWTSSGNPAGTVYRVETMLNEAGPAVASSDTYNTFLSTTGLSANTTYYFRLAALNNNGVVSNYDAARATSTLANIPVFAAFSNVAGSKIQYSWTANGNAAGTLYRVLTSTAADPLNPAGADVRSNDTTDNFLYLTGLIAQTTYYFKAAAINNNDVPTAYTSAQSTVTLPSQASTLYFRTAASALGGDALLMARATGSGTATYTRNTLTGPVTPPAIDTQFTAYPGSPVLVWYSYPLDEVTIAAPVTFNVWALENNNKANAAITAELYRTNGSGEIQSTIASAVLARPELGTAITAQSWARTPVLTALNNGDRLAVAWFIDDASGGTMPSGYAVSATLDGASSGVSGDSWVQLDETLAPARPSGFSVAAVSTYSVTAGWQLVEGATGYTLAASPDSIVPPVNISAASITASGSALLDTGLVPNTTYYLFARSNGPGASSSWAQFTATATLANTPVFNGFSNMSENSVQFNWTANNNPAGTHYRVVSSTASDWQNPGGAAVVSSDTYNLSLSSTGLAANTTYYFWAAALNHNGRITAYTSGNSTATLANAPLFSSFSGVGVSAIQLNWTAAGNSAGTLYRVKSSTASDWQNPGGAAVVSSDTYNLSLSSSGLSLNTTYYFWAAAVNRNGVLSSYTSGDSTSTLATTPVLSGFTVPSSGEIGISWTSGGNPAGTQYRVITSTASNWQSPGGAAVVSSDTYNLSLSSTGLYANTTYYFWAAALNHNGIITAYTSDRSTATLANAPLFSNFSGVGTSAIQLNWTAAGNSAGTLYRVKSSTASDWQNPGGAAVVSSDTYNLSLSSSGLSLNTTYYFWAAAVNRNGALSAYTSGDSTSTLATTPVLSGFTVPSSGEIGISWTSGGNPAGTQYRVITSTASNWQSPGGAAVVSSDTYNLSLSSTGLYANTTYYFWAAALNNNGIIIAYTSAASTSTLAESPAFGTFTSVGSGAIGLDWTSVNPPGTLYRAVSSTSSTPLDPGFAAAASSYTYNATLSSSGLVANTTYYFRIAAVNNNGLITAYSASDGTSTLAVQPSVFDFAGVSQVSMQLNWADPGNGPGTLYRVQVSTASNMDAPAGAVVTSTETYNLYVATSGLTYSTEYFFRAAAVNNNGIMTSYAAAGSTSTLAPGALSAPIAGGYSPYVSSITADWTLVSGATGYTLAVSLNPGSEPSPVLTSSITHGAELSAYVEGLSPDTIYYAFVRANGLGAVSAWGNYPAVATLLANPPVFDAFSGVGSDLAVFSWSANGNAYPATQYRVVSSTAPDPLDPGGAVAVSSYTYDLSLSSSGLSANTTYYFMTAGINKDGAPTVYTAVQATATAANAPVFTNFTGIGAGAIQFNWAGPGNPADTLYRVWTSTATDPLSPGGAAVTSSDTYNTYLSSSGLSVNTVYYFRVVGINRAGGYTAYTAAVGTATLANAPAFSGFTGVWASSAQFNWTAAGNPAGTLYRVLTSTALNPLAPSGAVVTGSDTYNFSSSSSGLVYNTTYYFVVAGVNSNGVVGDYFPAQSTPTLAAAPAFSGFTGMEASTLQLNWTSANPAGTLYRVWTSTASDPLNPNGAAATSSHTYNTYLSSSGLSANTTYYFSAAAISHAGIYTEYTVLAGTSSLAAAPVFGAFTDVSSFTARFNWTAPGNPAGTLYRVLVSTALNPLSPGGAAVTSSDTYSFGLSSSGLAADKAYYFRAAAFNNNGVASAYSGAESTYTLTAPPLFSAFTNVYSSSAQFNWSANGNPQGTLYRVLTSTAANPLAPGGAAVTSSDTYNTSLSSSGLGLNTLYYFRAAGVNGGGSPTAYTAAQSTRTLTDVPVTSGFTEVWASSVQFNWTGGANPAGTLYRVLASTAADPLNPDGAVVSSSDTYNMYLSTTGLAYNTTCYFRAAGVNADDTPGVYASAAATSTLANIPVFAGFSNVGSSKIQFAWTANGNPAGTLYRVLTSTASNPLSPAGAAVTVSNTADNYLFLTGLLSQTTYYFRVSALNNNSVETAYSAAQSTVTLTSVATTLYFRGATSSLGTDTRVMAASRGSAAVTYTKNTVPGSVTPPASATKFTSFGGGPVVTWYSYPLDEVTIAGGITFNIWARENNTAANATITAELYRTNAAGAVISTIAVAALARTELTTVVAKQTWLQTPVPTALSSGDRLAVAYYVDDASGVTMLGGYTVSASLDGPTAAVSGDSWIQVDETLAPARPAGFSVSAVSTFSVAAGWQLVEGATGYTLAASSETTVPPVNIAASSVTAAGSALLKSGLSPNTTYYLFARSNGPGSSSAWVQYTATATLADTPLFSGFSEVSATSVKFSWTGGGNPGGTLYRVKVSTASDPLAPNGAAVTTHDTYSLNITTAGLSVGAFYYFRVAAVNHNGVVTDYTVEKGTPTLAVYLNEVYPSGTSAPADWAELYNNTGNTLPLSGWKLNYVENTIAVGGTPITVWTGQAGDVILPYSTFSITGLSMDLNGALAYHVKLLNAYGGLMDQVQWPSLATGQSFARISDGNPSYFEIDPTPTPGYFNGVDTDTFRINEVAYGASGQFIELFNTSAVSTRTLTGYRLRNKVSSSNGLVFRFTRKIYPLSYAVMDFSSLSDDGYTFNQVFGTQGLTAAGDFLSLENASGSVVDAVSWQSAGNYPRYDNRGGALALADYAPANAAYSIIRQPTEGADTDFDAADFSSSTFETLGSRSDGAGLAADNTLTYPGDNSQPRFLSKRFPLALAFGQASGGGQANTVIFQRTGGGTDGHSPHSYRLADLGFDLDSLAAQSTAQYGPDFADQDGYTLVSSASYRMFFNSDTGSAAAEQIILDTVTYDASVHAVTGSSAAPLWMNDAARAAAIKLEVSNNSPAGFNGIGLTTITFSLLDADLNPLTQQEARNLFDAVMLAGDSAAGLAGIYEPGIDLSTAAYVPMASIEVDAAGLSTLTVSSQYLYVTSVPAASTRTFFVVLVSTRDASARTPSVFRVRLDAGSAGIKDLSGGLEQEFVPSAQVDTSSVTLIAPAEPPAGSSWPYVSPSSAPINTMVSVYSRALISTRTYVTSTDGYLRAVSAGGELLWEFATTPLSAINSSPSEPQEEGGAVYLYFADDNGDVYKVRDNGNSATPVWSPPRSLGIQIRSSVMIAGDFLYFGAADNKMHCIDKNSADGADCGGWLEQPVIGTLSGTPLIDDRTGVNRAWIGTEEGALVQFKTADGASVLSFPTGSAIRSSPFGDVGYEDSTNRLFITTTEGKLYVAPLDLGNAEQHFNAGAAIYTSPFVWTFSGEKFVFFGDDAGRMHKVSTRTWSEPAGWPFQAGGAIRSGPVVVPNWYVGLPAGEDYLYFGCDDGYIYAVNINTGQLRTGWPVATGGPVRADPVADSKGTISIGSNDGRTYVLDIGP